MLESKYGTENAVKHISELQDGDIVSIWDNHGNCELKTVYLGTIDSHDNFGLFEIQEGLGYPIGMRDFFSPAENSMYIIEKRHKIKTKCECGARHTSFKHIHLDWCPQHFRPQK